MWERIRAGLRRGFVVAFVVIWTVVGAQLFATGRPDSELFWIFYLAVWVWYLVTVVLPGRRRRAE